jgi:hypothetical protein
VPVLDAGALQRPVPLAIQVVQEAAFRSGRRIGQGLVAAHYARPQLLAGPRYPKRDLQLPILEQSGRSFSAIARHDSTSLVALHFAAPESWLAAQRSAANFSGDEAHWLTALGAGNVSNVAENIRPRSLLNF